MDTPTRDVLKLCADLKLEDLFYTYETDNPKILKERKLARQLLLGEAKRTFPQTEFFKSSNDVYFKLRPHKFLERINSVKNETHRQNFIERVKKLGDSKVYILFAPRHYEEIYSYLKEYLLNLDIKAYLAFTSIPSSLIETFNKDIPVHKAFPFVASAPHYPIIAFGTFTNYAPPLLKASGYKSEIIPCAFRQVGDRRGENKIKPTS